MKVYEQLLRKGICSQQELKRALSSAKRIKDPGSRNDVEWEITLNYAANRKFI